MLTLDALVPDRHVFDPERPLDAETIVADLVPQEDARTGTRAAADRYRRGRGAAGGNGAGVAGHAAATNGSRSTV